MKQPFSRYLAFLLLFPCWLSAQDITEQAVQAPDSSLTPTAVPTPTEVSTTAENPTPAAIPQIDSASAAPINYEITSYEPTTATPTDSLQAPDTTANAVPETAPIATTEIPVADTTQKEQQPQVAEANPKTEETQPKAEEIKQETEKAPATKDNKPKRFWGGITVGITYNDYFSTKFGLDAIKPGKDYKLSVSGADDLLSSFWGVGFKAGISCMFIASPYFNLRSDLNIALRQGTGKTNASVILDWKNSDKTDEKSDLEIEYSATQLNIDLPFLARVTIPGAIYFEAGPMFSFNVYS